MKFLVIALTVLGAASVSAPGASAQTLRGFGSFSVNSDVNQQVFPGVSGGVLLDLPVGWLTVGADGDLFVSWPYFAARVGPLAQLNLVRRGPIRLFGLAGFGWGEQGGPMLGAGMEAWTRGRLGIRVSAQDYLVRLKGFDCAALGYDPGYCDTALHGGRPRTGHQPSFQVGLVWR